MGKGSSQSSSDGNAAVVIQDGQINVCDSNNNTAKDPSLPLTFKVVSKTTTQSILWKFLIPTILAVSIAVLLATVQDFVVLQHHLLWIFGGAIFALIVFEITQHPSNGKHSTELVVNICPLGVQRSTHKSNLQQHHHPLLLAECIHDCIILEHVGAFAVSTHVMFRVLREKGDASSMFLVPAFPQARLSFEQCQGLQTQIQAALGRLMPGAK